MLGNVLFEHAFDQQSAPLWRLRQQWLDQGRFGVVVFQEVRAKLLDGLVKLFLYEFSIAQTAC